MKYLFTIIVSFAFVAMAAAQSRTETVAYQKINRQAVVNEIPFPEKTVRDAIENKMEQMGYKGKDVKGFTVYKGVRLADLGSDSYDLYFSADRKSRKEKEYSTLTLVIAKGFDSFVADSTDSRLMSNAKNYLDTIKVMIGAYDLEQQIIAQEDAIKKADKKYTNLIEDGQDLEKKRKNIENDIAENIKNQANQKAETEKQRQILETLRAKRKL
ncbi:hypothetical protein [Ferruginibacter sp.]|nr:hypothetical protein [Ferruginibacter sp.]